MTRVISYYCTCDGVWQEGLPVSVPSTAELEQPVGEGAPLSDHCVMERVLIIVNDGKQFSIYFSIFSMLILWYLCNIFNPGLSCNSNSSVILS